MNLRTMIFALGFVVCGWQWYSVFAQEPSRPVTASAQVPVAAPTTAVAGDETPREATPKELSDGELAISGRYARFERMLSQMADVLGRQDPERADLLRRAVGKGREDQVKENIELVVKLLSKGELGTATEKQSDVVASLEVLLKLLQSEDRRSSVERERERLNGLLKDVRSVLAEQKSARAATQNAEAPSSAAPGQQKALKETEKMLDSMKEHDDQEAKTGQKEDESEAESSEGENSDGKSSKAENSDGKSEGKPKSPEDGQPKGSEKGEQGKKSEGDLKGKKSGGEKSSDGELKDGQESPEEQDSQQGKAEGKKGDKSESEKGKSQDKSSSGKSQSGQKKSGQKRGGKESKQTPGREQLEKAQEQMEEALEKLKEQDRKEALESEDKAIEELHEAAAKLEEMLKQLREEEKEMLLASLEARFQRMLAAETQINEGTVSLAATPQKDWLDQYYGRCRELAQLQMELTTECAQTVNLLREDGTSVSILLAVEDIESDMGSVSDWLQESKVEELTQSVQADIIQSLKQLIETTQKEMQEMKEQQQQQKQQQQSEKKEGLVELMAEIRMLRNLQLQVNRRTKQVNGLLQTAPADDLPAVRKQVHDLSVRQRRLTESAKELARQAQ